MWFDLSEPVPGVSWVVFHLCFSATETGVRVEPRLIGVFAVKRRMWAAGVVEAKELPDRGAGLGHAGIGPQIDLLIFDDPPVTPDEGVVVPGPFAVHADPDLTICQNFDDVGGGELAVLIGVEDVGLAVPGSFPSLCRESQLFDVFSTAGKASVKDKKGGL